jgi:putative efflux protein, MATE family
VSHIAEHEITLEDKALYKLLAKIAIPIAIQGVVSATLGLVDNLMVGYLGEAELAAVGIATQIFFIHYLFLFGFTSGTATFMAQFYGAGDQKSIRKVVGFAMTVALGVGLLFFVIGFFFTEQFLHIYSDDPKIIAMAVPYVKICAPQCFTLAISVPFESAFKATQRTKIPLVVSSVTFTTNTFLNYVLIFGKFGAPALGISGAAAATLTARVFEVLLSFYFATRKDNALHGSIHDFFDWDREILKRVIKNALPTTGNELMWSIGTSLFVAAYSRIGTTSYAAYQAASSINSIFSFAAFSVGDATLILVGQKLGEGDGDYAWYLGKKLLKIGTIFGALCGLLVIAFAKPMVGFFALTPEGSTDAFRILVVFGCLMGLSLYNGINVTGILRGGGDTRFAMFAEIGCIWLVGVPLAFAASLWWQLPIYLVVLVVRSYDVAEAVLMTKRFWSKKWIKNVIKGL